MKCRICAGETHNIFQGIVLTRNVNYFLCNECGFLSTEEPYWLEEAYNNSINESDTGILTRNIRLARLTALIILVFFDNDGTFVDYAGGYGLLVRLLRDWGFNFRWHDRYTDNIFAIGFEQDPKKDTDKIELITCFEAVEHFVDPGSELDEMLKVSSTILFSTQILPAGPPQLDAWWYYGPEHGQHVSFYSLNSLQVLAKSRDLNFYSDGHSVHLFSKRRLPKILLQSIFRTRGLLDVSLVVKMIKGSKTWPDYLDLKNRVDQ